MIPIGPSEGPGVYENSDRWGQPTADYSARWYFYIDSITWKKLQWFQVAVPVPKSLSIDDILTKPWLPYCREIEARVKWAGNSCLKQLSVTAMDGQTIRIVAELGREDRPPTFRRWSLWERTVGYRLSQLKAWRMNRSATKSCQ